MKLYIDGAEADIDERLQVSVTHTIAHINEPEYGRAGYSHSITIPMTPHNRRLMRNCEDVNSRDRFNGELHAARLEEGGAVLIDGTAVLTGCDSSLAGGFYMFNIIGSSKLWASHASAYGFSTLYPEYSATINATTIKESWTADTPVRFLPVQRDYYEPYNGTVGIRPPERVLTASDYHPFIHIRSVVDEIFSEAGFRVCSKFMDGEFFRSLYMSGNYPARDVSIQRRRMDFRAERFAEVSAVADSNGRVYADPNLNYNTIGNIVDTADPHEVSDGATLPDVFTNNGCFRRSDDGRVMFVPLNEISMGFEYKLTYVTDYRMKDSSELAGFDTICLGDGYERHFSLFNPFAERSEEFRAGKLFRCIVFDHIAGSEYRLEAKRITNANADPQDLRDGDYETVTLGQFSAGSATVSTTVAGNYSGLTLRVRGLREVSFREYNGGWGLFDGAVEATGRTEVAVTVRSNARTVKPSAPKYFDDVCFAGANAGMTFTLLSAVVRPVFSPHPAEGSKVTFAEIAAHGISRMDVINGLRHMFNLWFYTDNVGKTVCIEPRSEFFTGGTVDWSDRIDLSKPYRVEELGRDMAAKVTFRYAGGDGAVKRLNVEQGGSFGSWSFESGNPYVSVNEKVYENPLFTASVNEPGMLLSAPSAALLQAGDRDTDADLYSDDFNFPPKVVRYAGMAVLPEGERWGWPAYGSSYPCVYFHAAAGSEGTLISQESAGRSLCFDDTDGMTGLKGYWAGMLDTCRRGRKLTAWLRLRPYEIEQLAVPNRLGHDFRASFRFRIDGETSLWRLEEVSCYDPSAVSTKCVFIQQLSD